MRSIIEEIAEAEVQADRIRQDAIFSAKEMIKSARKEAEEANSSAEAADHAKLREATAKAEVDGNIKASAILEKTRSEADASAVSANERMKIAVDYIIKKVQESV